MVTVIDYDAGNLGSITNMLKKLCVSSERATSIADIERAKKIILPGVGSFSEAKRNLSSRGFFEVIKRKVESQATPILGICLGMQLFAEESEEGGESGFGWIRGKVQKLSTVVDGKALKVPHMGWNVVRMAKTSKVLREEERELRFYFAHSYFVNCENKQDILGITTYGGDFVSAVERGLIIGVQFHPEKSHGFGLRLLKRFVEEF